MDRQSFSARPRHATSVIPLSLLTALFASQVEAKPWSRSFVIDWWGNASYYGAKEPNQPGTDCPRGANPENDWETLLREAGYEGERIQSR